MIMIQILHISIVKNDFFLCREIQYLKQRVTLLFSTMLYYSSIIK